LLGPPSEELLYFSDLCVTFEVSKLLRLLVLLGGPAHGLVLEVEEHEREDKHADHHGKVFVAALLRCGHFGKSSAPQLQQ